ncbi:TssQ family T6SS-associated lipoprotein [Massilia sp. PAMC28688]|uniref:TssQ family T6SS-associated lipoprotein n=1 Tax=Massilia sp. PAMC28688 TaxID=2861283 RepID=UPI001C62A59A|nr:TssQ family T6SS-associated lipoprotein [Massilia sp. PAMC28688]QYF92513.1 TssQ family T6SS-associated lipoprotein [Massilia sp. PAMC28688]
MSPSISRTLFLAIAATLALTGCETVGPMVGIKPDGPAAKPATAPSQASRPAPGSPGNPNPPAGSRASEEQQSLREGIELYNKGQFNDAIKRLSAPEIAGGTRAGHLQALKYMAFSYCVTSRTTLCRQAFEKAFKLDPSFDLQPGEHGHPLWGPAFERARKQSSKS